MLRQSLRIPRTLLLLAVSIPSALAVAQPAAAPAAGVGQDLSITPKNGQTQEQQWADRYACHGWSKSQSGYDPTRAGGGVAPEEVASRREQYQRAMTACLEARGYSVRYAAPAPPLAAPAPGAAPVVVPPSAPPPRWQPVRSAAYPELNYHPLLVQLDGGYVLTEGSLKPLLHDGGTVGLGLTWFPTSALPLGLRVDASYSRFDETQYSRALESAATGTDVAFGHQDLYGGDADVQLDLAHRSSRMKMYLFGGFGRYRERTVFKQVTYQQGQGCTLYCGTVYFPVFSTVQPSTSDWLNAWNAGFGMEFPISDPGSFFIEARYLRISPYGANNAFVPIVLGLRF
jgi:Outer membrane protein beta-barrel domain